jgi:amino acid transporter
MDVARTVGGPLLFTFYGIVLLVSSLACGLAGQIGAARLLYSMGRDDVIPRKLFGHLSQHRGTPIYNEWLIGGLAYIAVMTIPWQRSAEMVTFGALLAFTAVNFAALMQFWFAAEAKTTRQFFRDAFVPGFGCVFCFGLLLGLQPWTKYAGLVWLVAGTIYAAYRTRLFRMRATLINFGEGEAKVTGSTD